MPILSRLGLEHSMENNVVLRTAAISLLVKESIEMLQPKITDNEMNSLRSLARDIVNDMEEASQPVMRHLHFEECLARQVRNDVQWGFHINQNVIQIKITIIRCSR